MKKIFKTDPMFLELFKINMLNANITRTKKKLKEKRYIENPEEIYKDVFFHSYIYSLILFLFIYSMFFFQVDFGKFPTLVDASIIMFVLLSCLMSFPEFFNSFYQSSDIYGYMALPIDEKTVFDAKSSIVLLSAMQLATPVIILLFMYFFKIYNNILVSVIFSLADFLIVMGIINAINTILLVIFSKTSVIAKHKKTIFNFMIVISNLVNIGFIIYIQNFFGKGQRFTVSKNGMKAVNGPITNILSNTNSHIIMIAVFSAIFLILYFTLIRNIRKNFYKTVRNLSQNNYEEKETKSKKTGYKIKKSGFFRELFKYNLRLISDPTILSQAISGVALVIVIMIPQSKSLIKTVNSLDIENNGLMFSYCTALVIPIITQWSPTNIASILLSLDGKNSEYIKSLPILQKSYTIYKLIFSVIIQCSLPFILYLVLMIYVRMNFIYVIAGICVFLTVAFLINSRWILYDKKHLFTNWQNISEIYQRFSKGAFMIYTFFFFIFFFFLTSVVFFIMFNISYTASLIIFFLTEIICLFIIKITLKSYEKI